jgi:hypothetical protein
MSTPEMRRAASAKGSPKSQSSSHTEDIAEATAALQAEKLCRLYFLCRATAATIASLAFGVCR